MKTTSVIKTGGCAGGGRGGGRERHRAVPRGGGGRGHLLPGRRMSSAGAETIVGLIERPELRPSASLRRAVAERYTWTAHAATIADAYARLAGLPTARA